MPFRIIQSDKNNYIFGKNSLTTANLLVADSDYIYVLSPHVSNKFIRKMEDCQAGGNLTFHGNINAHETRML